MKLLIPLIVLATISTAHAHPGGNKLVCKTAAGSTSSQKIEVSIIRSNGKGWFAPSIELKINNHNHELYTPEETNNYGVTFHNSPLKTITVTAEVPNVDNLNSGDFSIVAMPETVKSFDYDGKPTTWSLEAEKDECYDSAGSADFKAILRGFLYFEKENLEIEPQLMDCKLIYNSGMAC